MIHFYLNSKPAKPKHLIGILHLSNEMVLLWPYFARLLSYHEGLGQTNPLYNNKNMKVLHQYRCKYHPMYNNINILDNQNTVQLHWVDSLSLVSLRLHYHTLDIIEKFLKQTERNR